MTVWTEAPATMPHPYKAVHVYAPDSGLDIAYWASGTWRRVNGTPVRAEPTHWTRIIAPQPPADPVTLWLTTQLASDRTDIEAITTEWWPGPDGIPVRVQTRSPAARDRLLMLEAHEAILRIHTAESAGHCGVCTPPGRPTAPQQGRVPMPCPTIRALARCYAARTGFEPAWSQTETAAFREIHPDTVTGSHRIA